MRVRLVGLAIASGLLLAGTGCTRDATKTAPPGESEEELPVPEGYRGVDWGTSRDAIRKKHPDLEPGKNDPGVLVRATKITGEPATEAFFFDGEGGLEEVEIRYVPKRIPAESATLVRNMGEMFGGHQVTHAGEDLYQVAWIGKGTEVRLTYDLRESTPFGPVVTYARRAEQEAPGDPDERVKAPGQDANPDEIESANAPAGNRFASAVRNARAAGMRLQAVEAGRGKLTLLYGGPSEGLEVALSSDPKTGALVGAAVLPRAPLEGAGQRRAESAIDRALAGGSPDSLRFGEPLKGMVTLGFGEEGFVALDPDAPDALAGTSANDPR